MAPKELESIDRAVTSYRAIVVCAKIEVVKNVAKRIKDKLLERLAKIRVHGGENPRVPPSVVEHEKIVILEWIEFIDYLNSKLSRECSRLCKEGYSVVSAYECRSSLEEVVVRMTGLKSKAPLALRAALLDVILSLKELEDKN